MVNLSIDCYAASWDQSSIASVAASVFYHAVFSHLCSALSYFECALQLLSHRKEVLQAGLSGFEPFVAIVVPAMHQMALNFIKVLHS